jgi:hypothetical protein
MWIGSNVPPRIPIRLFITSHLTAERAIRTINVTRAKEKNARA